MIYLDAFVRAWLLSQSSITSLTDVGNLAQGIYAAPDLPEKCDPKLGPMVQLWSGGSPQNADIPELVDGRITIKCWAGVEQYDVAHQLYRAVRSVMHGACGVTVQNQTGRIIRCNETVSGQTVTDPETGWATVVAIYEVEAA